MSDAATVITPASADDAVEPDDHEVARRANPFPGPKPYGIDGALFLGRDREVTEVIQLLNASGMLLLYAESGSGKSSVLMAGVARRLTGVRPAAAEGETQHGSDAGEYTIIGPVRPSRHLMNRGASGPDRYVDALRAYVAERVGTTDGGLDDHADQLSLGGLVAGVGRRVLLVIDQLEEIFADDFHGRSNRALTTLFAELTKAAGECADLYVVLSMRSDYLAQFLLVQGSFEGHLVRYYLQPLRRPALDDIVRQSFEQSGLPIPSTVVDKILSELEVADEEPETDGQQVLGPGSTDPAPHESDSPTSGRISMLTLQIYCKKVWGDARRQAPSEVWAEIEQGAYNLRSALDGWVQETLELAARPTGADAARLGANLELNFLTAHGSRKFVETADGRIESLPPNILRQLTSEGLLTRAQYRDLEGYELAHDRLAPALVRANASLSKRSNPTRRFWSKLQTPAAAVLAVAATTALYLAMSEPSDSGRADPQIDTWTVTLDDEGQATRTVLPAPGELIMARSEFPGSVGFRVGDADVGRPCASDVSGGCAMLWKKDRAEASLVATGPADTTIDVEVARIPVRRDWYGGFKEYMAVDPTLGPTQVVLTEGRVASLLSGVGVVASDTSGAIVAPDPTGAPIVIETGIDIDFEPLEAAGYAGSLRPVSQRGLTVITPFGDELCHDPTTIAVFEQRKLAMPVAVGLRGIVVDASAMTSIGVAPCYGWTGADPESLDLAAERPSTTVPLLPFLRVQAYTVAAPDEGVLRLSATEGVRLDVLAPLPGGDDAARATPTLLPWTPGQGGDLDVAVEGGQTYFVLVDVPSDDVDVSAELTLTVGFEPTSQGP